MIILYSCLHNSQSHWIRAKSQMPCYEKWPGSCCDLIFCSPCKSVCQTDRKDEERESSHRKMILYVWHLILRDSCTYIEWESGVFGACLQTQANGTHFSQQCRWPHPNVGACWGVAVALCCIRKSTYICKTHKWKHTRKCFTPCCLLTLILLCFITSFSNGLSLG